MSDLGAAQSTFKSASPEKIPPIDFFARERQHPFEAGPRAHLNFWMCSARRAAPGRAPLAVPMNRDVGLDIKTGGLVFVEFHRP
jgi:hypothetical protein